MVDVKPATSSEHASSLTQDTTASTSTPASITASVAETKEPEVDAAMFNVPMVEHTAACTEDCLNLSCPYHEFVGFGNPHTVGQQSRRAIVA